MIGRTTSLLRRVAFSCNATTTSTLPQRVVNASPSLLQSTSSSSSSSSSSTSTSSSSMATASSVASSPHQYFHHAATATAATILLLSGGGAGFVAMGQQHQQQQGQQPKQQGQQPKQQQPQQQQQQQRRHFSSATTGARSQSSTSLYQSIPTFATPRDMYEHMLDVLDQRDPGRGALPIYGYVGRIADMSYSIDDGNDATDAASATAAVGSMSSPASSSSSSSSSSNVTGDDDVHTDPRDPLVIETALFPRDALDFYTRHNLCLLHPDTNDADRALYTRYYDAARGGGQGDYRHDMLKKIQHIIDCLQKFPLSKRACLTIPYSRTTSGDADHTLDDEAKCLRELHFFLAPADVDADATTPTSSSSSSSSSSPLLLHCHGLMRANAATIFPKNIHYIGTLQRLIARRLHVPPGTYTHFTTHLISGREN